jgi:hypothetical protein
MLYYAGRNIFLIPEGGGRNVTFISNIKNELNIHYIFVHNGLVNLG